jgi:transportin-3
MVVMAANGSGQQAFAPVLAAMVTMRDGQREQKKAAHVFLESFQKSVRLDGGFCSLVGYKS